MMSRLNVLYDAEGASGKGGILAKDTGVFPRRLTALAQCKNQGSKLAVATSPMATNILL